MNGIILQQYRSQSFGRILIPSKSPPALARYSVILFSFSIMTKVQKGSLKPIEMRLNNA
jgi:hypothetical protein